MYEHMYARVMTVAPLSEPSPGEPKRGRPSSYSRYCYLFLPHLWGRQAYMVSSVTCRWRHKSQTFDVAVYVKLSTLKPGLEVNKGAAEVRGHQGMGRHWQQHHTDRKQRRLTSKPGINTQQDACTCVCVCELLFSEIVKIHRKFYISVSIDTWLYIYIVIHV